MNKGLRWSLALSVAPATDLITLDEAKAHLRVDDAASDTYIENTLIPAALQGFDGAAGCLGRALITQTWLLYLDSFPDSGRAIQVPLSPLQSITSIAYVDTEGASQTWAASKYIVDNEAEPGLVTPAYNEVYPSTRDQLQAVTITYKAGYGLTAATVPERIRQRILIEIADLYEHRQTAVIGVTGIAIPRQPDDLIYSYRVGVIG